MNIFEVQLLAEQALGLTPNQADEIIDNGEDYDTPLLERFGVNLEQFGDIARALLPLTPLIEDPTSSIPIHAFVRREEDGHAKIIVKKAAN